MVIRLTFAVFDRVGEVDEIVGGDGQVFCGELKHVEVLVGDTCEHGDEDTDQTGDRQAKRHCDANKSSSTHCCCGIRASRLLIVGGRLDIERVSGFRRWVERVKGVPRLQDGTMDYISTEEDGME